MSKNAAFLRFHFPELPLPLRGRVALALAESQGRPDPEVLARLIQEPGVSEAIRARVASPQRRSESLLARLAREEILRRVPHVEGWRGCSFSHSSMKSEEGDGVRIFSAAALADGPVGVDLEHEGRSFSRTGRERIVSRILHGSERDQVGLELVFWCAKESLAKALGTGLVAPLEQYETQMLGLETSISGHFRLGFRHFPGWEAQVFRFSGWILSVCLPQE